MRVDHTRAIQQRGLNVYKMVHMDTGRAITCKGCGEVMIVGDYDRTANRMHELMDKLKGKQGQQSAKLAQ